MKRAAWMSMSPMLWAAAACLDNAPDESTDVTAQADSSDATDGAVDTEVPDTEVPDTGVPDTEVPDTGVPDAPWPEDVCVPGDGGPIVGLARFDEAAGNTMPIELDGTTLYGRRGAVVAGQQRYQIVQRALPGGQERAIVSETDVPLPIDARDDVLLYSVLGSDASIGVHLYYQDLRGGAAIELAQGDNQREGRPMIVPPPFGWEENSRVVERGAAAWGEMDGWALGPNRVRIWRDGETETLWESAENYPSHLHLRNGYVLWTVNAVPNLWLGHAGMAPIQLPAQVATSAILTDTAAWWIDDGEVSRYDLGTGETRQVLTGPCGTLAADGARVITLCGPEMTYDPDKYAIGRGRPVVTDGQQAIELTTLGGAQVGAVRVLGRRVVWVEYGAHIGACDTFERGRLVLSSLDTPSAPRELATVGSGGWACSNSNYYWHHLDIAISDRGLAWNYPISDSPTEPGASYRDFIAPVGWAVFTDAECL